MAQIHDRIEELERALTPFANYAAGYTQHHPQAAEAADDFLVSSANGRVLTLGHCIRAAEALAKESR